ncbi:hypothetical protein E3N88_07067 [Mikania micrantha]|uniref:C3H1-type domain-containing protein n=1 Tax=Mikania micrantha TaxID=192012 RepID=A0A5N6PR72_9ASTR|nr:hypothetical protein E3N88_07067 [Mikania micrantha]
MSGRRRRSETLWDDKEEKGRSAEFHSTVSPGRPQNWSKSEVNDNLMHGNFSRSPSWDTLQGNRNGPNDDDIRRDRNRMHSNLISDGWEQHSTHPSDDSYSLPYRPRDKEIGGNARMSRERARERSRSPNRSRSRSRDGVSRSRRYETNASYPNMRNNSKDFGSRGGGNNVTGNWSRRADYKDGSRYNDYPHRTTYDNNRNTRIPCRYFAAGNCNRDNCRFLHDIPEAAKGYDDNRNLGNKNRTWHIDQQPHDDQNARSNLDGMEKKKSWNSSVWDDVKSGGFDETSRQGHTLDDHSITWDSKKRLLDGDAARDASGHHDVGKSYPYLDNKKNSWDGPTSWDDVKSGSFDETSCQGHTLDENNAWDFRNDKKKLLDGHGSREASGFHDVGKSNPNLDSKKSSWDGPTSWDGVGGSGFSSVSNLFNIHEESSKNSLNDNNAKGRISAKSGSNIDRNNTKKWDGPLWDEVSEPVRKWRDPDLDRKSSDNVENVVKESDLNNIVPEDAIQHVLNSGNNLIQGVHDMNTRSLSYLNGPEQSHTLLSKPFDGLLNGQVQGTHVRLENQNEVGKLLKPLEVDVSQPQAVNNVNETSLTSQLASQTSAPLTEISHKGQLPQLYADLHINNAIDYLKSLPNSANNQDARAKEEVKVSALMGMLSDSVTQQNQMPVDLTHDSSKMGQIDVTEKKIVDEFDKKGAKNSKKEENTNLDNFEARGKAEEADIVNDEKAMRQFKVGLVDFVKEILKPKWKEGKMSREVHKAVVKKVVEKVTSTIQGTQIPRTQPKIEQYLTYSKPKITKLVEAYMERLVKA